MSEQALTAIIPKATAILVSAPPHTNAEEVRINLQLQKEREKNEFYMRSIWSVCFPGDSVSSDHRWHLTTPSSCDGHAVVAITHRSLIKANITVFDKQQPQFIVPGTENYPFQRAHWMNKSQVPERNLEELSMYLLSSFVVNGYV